MGAAASTDAKSDRDEGFVTVTPPPAMSSNERSRVDEERREALRAIESIELVTPYGERPDVVELYARADALDAEDAVRGLTLGKTSPQASPASRSASSPSP